MVRAWLLPVLGKDLLPRYFRQRVDLAIRQERHAAAVGLNAPHVIGVTDPPFRERFALGQFLVVGGGANENFRDRGAARHEQAQRRLGGLRARQQRKISSVVRRVNARRQINILQIFLAIDQTPLLIGKHAAPEQQRGENEHQHNRDE